MESLEGEPPNVFPYANILVPDRGSRASLGAGAAREVAGLSAGFPRVPRSATMPP